MKDGELKAQQSITCCISAKIIKKRSSRVKFPFATATVECLPGAQTFSN